MHQTVLRRMTIAGLVVALTAAQARAAGRVELTVITDRAAPITAQQEWLRALAKAGVPGARFTGNAPGRELGVVAKGDPDRPTYVVTAKLDSSGELVLPGQRFRQSEAARLARWLDELASQGLPEEREPKSAFGLAREEFERVHADMAQPVAFSTEGENRDAVVRQIARGLVFPLALDRGAAGRVGSDPVPEELMGISQGTALAYLLHDVGLGIVPRDDGGGQVQYAVLPARPGMTIWPVGWEPERPRRELVPGLFEFLTVNVQGVSVAKVIEAVSGRLELPVLWDRSALAAQGIDPSKTMASVPSSRTTYSLLLSKALFQARLKSEIRVDEADGPLLWITTIKRN